MAQPDPGLSDNRESAHLPAQTNKQTGDRAERPQPRLGPLLRRVQGRYGDRGQNCLPIRQFGRIPSPKGPHHRHHLRPKQKRF